MNDDTERGPGGEPVGTVAEEAAKLFEALQGWVHTEGSAAPPQNERERPDLSDHAHDGEATDCRWCPLCRAATVLRQTSPEVRDHLAEAATSLLSAGAAFLEARAARAAAAAPAAGAPEEDPTSGLEHIDLDVDDAWDAD